jgi:hypothetical protein
MTPTVVSKGMSLEQRVASFWEAFQGDVEAHDNALDSVLEEFDLSSITIASKNLQVTDEESNVTCLALYNQCGTAEKRIMEHWKRPAEVSDTLHSTITDRRGKRAKIWKSLKDIFSAKSGKFIMEQRAAKRREEEALAQIEAQRKRELEREADALLSRGYVEAAQAKIQQAAVTDMPTLPDAVGKIEGSRIGTTWKAEGVDLIGTMRAIVAGQIPILWDNGKGEQEPILVYNQQVLNAIAKRSQGSLKIPGVKFIEGVRIGASKLS